MPYIDDTEIESYYEYMVNVAVKLGAVKEVASSDLQKALQFKLKFRRVSFAKIYADFGIIILA